MPKSLTPRLAQLKDEIEGYARGFGLDFFETVFELLGYDELNMVASYGGFPNRYPHWRWGMEYEQLSKGYEYGLSKIYELVINNDPCYAYLLESNAEVDQKLVMAHVYGHCDFFKNNFYFQHTNRRMMDEMANHATRVRRWVDKVGIEKVEDFIDRALSLENLIDYADHHSGTLGTRPGALNPYKLGIELYRDIEERWNKGRFGKEWDECDDLRTRRAWDKNLGLGREKVFEVRKHYNDVTFIDTFLTPEFAMEQKLFVYGFNEKRNSWEILDREFRKVKNKLLSQLTNFGQPIVEVVDGNFENRGELLLAHKHDGQDLKPDYARETLRNLQTVWRRPCNLVTKVEGKGVCLRFDGQNQTEKKVEL